MAKDTKFSMYISSLQHVLTLVFMMWYDDAGAAFCQALAPRGMVGLRAHHRVFLKGFYSKSLPGPCEHVILPRLFIFTLVWRGCGRRLNAEMAHHMQWTSDGYLSSMSLSFIETRCRRSRRFCEVPALILETL